MFGVVLHIVVVLGLLVGTITDLKKREVPDWLNFSLIGAGFGLALLKSIFISSFQPIAASALGFILGVIIGYVMYYAGQWGGGDSKMIMGLGALFGLFWQPISLQSTPFFLIFIINTILVGAIYGLAWMLGLIIIKFKTFKRSLN